MLNLHIDTGNSAHVHEVRLRQSFEARAELHRQIVDILDVNIIRHSRSLYCSPALLVQKKNNKQRFCIDYWILNAVTVSVAYLMPQIEEVLDDLVQSTYLTTLDLCLGYWQVEMDDDLATKTSFCSYDGLFKFCWMLFGLKDVPAVFQRMMRKVLDGITPTIAIPFLGDIIVHTNLLSTFLRPRDSTEAR